MTLSVRTAKTIPKETLNKSKAHFDLFTISQVSDWRMTDEYI